MEVNNDKAVNDLAGMEDDEIKKLNRYSSDLNIIGGLSLFSAVGMVLTLMPGMEEMRGDEISVVGVAVIAVILSANAYACLIRPRWGSVVCGFFSMILLLGIPIGTILGVLGIRAAANGEKLFGVDRIKGHQLGEAIAKIERQIP